MLEDDFIPASTVETEKLLAEWRWLIGDKKLSLHAVAAVGNLFLMGESGRIYLLAIEDGTCHCIAQSTLELREKLGDRHNRRAWLKGFAVRDLLKRGVWLAPGQCYGMKVPFHLGGADGAADDYEPIDLTVHVSILGQIHRQTTELSPGEPVDEVEIPVNPEL